MHDESTIIEAAREYVRLESDAVRAVAEQINEEFVRFAREISEVQGKVIVTGAGTSGTIAHRLAHLLSVTGTPSFYLSPVDAIHGSLGAVSSGDMVLAISKGGESSELTEMIIRSGERGAKTVALTSASETSLGRVAQKVIVVDSSAADLGGVVATGSTLAHAAWGDALCMTLMEMKQYGWDRVLHSHPGGAVGQKDIEDVL